MKTRPLGGTDMRVGVLGFGGAEIGFERANAAVSAAVGRGRGVRSRRCTGS